MQNVACPNCGAPVTFKSHASVQAVCEFCQTTVVKEAGAVKNMGKMSDVLEDYSPVQIGTAGTHAGKEFTVIGRIQLRYSAGMWNEWYLSFSDGSNGWLGDSSGLYTLTAERYLPETRGIRFAGMAPGQHVTIAEKSYTVAETRQAECVAGQGELPFQVGGGWPIQVVDLRHGNLFLTLDFTDEGPPHVYIGAAVTLEQLQCQLLRDEDEVKTSAGKYKGKVDALECPSCGSSIKYLPGVTTTLVCQSCSSQIDAASPKAQVLEAGKQMAQVHTTLELGSTAMIDGAKQQIIGVMQRADDEGTVWTEYLLYNASKGFIWLVETNEGWYRTKVQADWPRWNGGDEAVMSGRPFRKRFDYPARVTFAAGAFNWRVNAGDETRVIDFAQDRNLLSAEMTANELTWSYGVPVAADQIRAWFGKNIAADKQGSASGITFSHILKGMLVVNAIPILFGSFSSIVIVAVTLLAIYLPMKFMGDSDKGA